MTIAFISLMHIKNSRGTGKQYIATLIKNGVNSTNKPIIKGL